MQLYFNVMEAGHPLSEDIKRQMYIDQTRISHIINKFNFVNNEVRGIVETAQTQVGKDMKGLVQQGSEVAFSMRGMGNVIKKDGQYERILGPLMIVTYDWVVFPSHPNAYMTRKLSESYNMTTEYSNNEIKNMNKSKVITFDMRELLSYVTSSSKKVKELTESFEFGINSDMSNVSLDEDHNMINIKEGNDTLKCFLESSLKAEINDYFKNL